MTKIAFNTANLVGRETGYRFKLDRWMEQDAITRERTDERVWAQICKEIASAGYSAVEIWVAHVDPARLTDARAKQFARILNDSGLTPIGLAAPLTDDTARVCLQLGIPVCNGGWWGTTPADVTRIRKATGVQMNYENHPEKSVGELVAKLQTGDGEIGVALDTGWLGTQGVDAVSAVRELGSRIRHVHLKDVKNTGGHETCRLSEGVVQLEKVIAALEDIGYAGWYSWEDEPEDRDPMDIAAEMRAWIEARVGR